MESSVKPMNVNQVVFSRLVSMYASFQDIPILDYSDEFLDCLDELRLALSRCLYRVASSKTIENVHFTDRTQK